VGLACHQLLRPVVKNHLIHHLLIVDEAGPQPLGAVVGRPLFAIWARRLGWRCHLATWANRICAHYSPQSKKAAFFAPFADLVVFKELHGVSICRRLVDMQLRNARVCLDCEELHEQPECPVCASEAFVYVTRWMPASERRGPDRLPRRPAVEAAELSSPPSKVKTWIGRGLKGMAVVAIGRLFLEVILPAPDPRGAAARTGAPRDRAPDSARPGRGASADHASVRNPRTEAP
jgi:hypothetical protein